MAATSRTRSDRTLTSDARTLARVLGGSASGNRVRAPGPGHSPHDRSLSIFLDPNAPDGFVVYSFAGDDPLLCRDHVRAAIGLPAFGSTARLAARASKNRLSAPVPDACHREDAALAIWRRTVALPDTPGDSYLRQRGLALDLTWVSDLRFHPALRFEGGTTPGMVALMRDVRTKEPCGIHRTFLSRAGGKLGRKMLGRAKGACVKLSADEDVTLGLGIAEGIETALTVLQLGWGPIWACLSAGTVRDFTVLPGIEALTVFADHDETGTGEAAARDCCVRWRASGPLSPPRSRARRRWRRSSGWRKRIGALRHRSISGTPIHGS